MWHLIEMWQKPVEFVYIALHGVTRSYLVIYYPSYGDVDIDQLEMYDYWVKIGWRVL